MQSTGPAKTSWCLSVKLTQQFTKLNAAARASGFTVEEVEEVYRGLAAANTALGGDSQKLQGILLATQQVFSKGKVQAEELPGPDR